MTTKEAIQRFEREFDLIGFEIVRQLVTELRAQNHVATGALIHSIVSATAHKLDQIEVQITNLKYGADLNTGVPASKVPRTGTSAYLKLVADLVKWISFRKLAHGAAQQMRFARNIVRKAQKTGFPTPGAYKFSRNGRRTMWIDWVVQAYGLKWEGRVEQASLDLASNYLDAKILEIQKRYAAVFF